MSDELVLWKKNELPALPPKADVKTLISLSAQLNERDKKQIIRGFKNESYEIVSTYIWTKAITSLKHQLSKMGIHFIAEMLDRPDINEHTDIQKAISEYEAIQLGEQLGVITGTSAFRLKHALETINHFNQPELDDDPENSISSDEAKSIIRACVSGVLRYDKIEAPIDFKIFRETLELTTVSEENQYVIKLTGSPYFFHRATIRILISLIKSSSSAQLENALANANIIIPIIWKNLQAQERWQLGRTYSELFTEGKSKAASGLKQVLLKVGGFDYVPEDLRAAAFIRAANDVLFAHDNRNNFYNEPAPMSTLSSMGSVIPMAAFHVCITASLCVKLGNYFGISTAAQESANSLLKNVTLDRWVYFFNECFVSNERILYKLTSFHPTNRWTDLFKPGVLDLILPKIKDRSVSNLIKYTKEKDIEKVSKIANSLLQKSGYANK